LEEKGQNRRCSRLRRSARNAFANIIPHFERECGVLKALVDEDDLEKYFDIYGITVSDLNEAALGFSESEFEDQESLRVLRILQYRCNIQRRVFLCSLLTLEADGGKPDFVRWKVAIDAMSTMASIAGTSSEKINTILGEEDRMLDPTLPLCMCAHQF
jgi:hypothetical protein